MMATWSCTSVYDCGSKTINERVSAFCMHPGAEGVHDLLQLTNTQLKTRMKELGVVTAGVDQRINAALRSAIWKSCKELAISATRVPLDKEDARRLGNSFRSTCPHTHCSEPSP